MNWCISNSSYLVQNKPKLLQSENSYWLLSENLSWDASRIIFIVGTSPIVCDVGSSVSAFPADVLDQQAPLHPPIFCHHSLKLLSPTLPKLMNWILLSSPPLSSDPDNPPKFGTCTNLLLLLKYKRHHIDFKKHFHFIELESFFPKSSHVKSCRIPTGLSRARVPPPSFQNFEMIPGVQLLTGFHRSRDLVSYPFVKNP